ncbi:MAG: carboxypeptidase-like regulatory domain-containing protein [Planctomycetota bacterium]
MIVALTAALAFPQSIEAAPSLAEEGTPVVVRVVDVERRPLAGVRVVVGTEDGPPVASGETDERGEFRFEAREPGDHGVRADVDGPRGEGRVRLLAPLHVVARPPRLAWRVGGAIVAAAFVFALVKRRAAD